MSRYAENTEVSADKSRAEIERTLQRYGAGSFMYGWDGNRAVIAFGLAGRKVQMILTLPDKSEFRFTPGRRLERSESQIHAAWEQACRQSWRALALVIKAKLEAVEAGIATVEDEFLAYTMLPNKATVGQWMQPQIERALSSGQMPEILPMLAGRSEVEP